MGLWNKILGGAMIAGGAIGAPFTGGASLALVGAGAGMLGSESAKEQEQEAADQAIKVQQDVYAQRRADAAPWTNVGGQAMTTLGAAMGLPSGPVGGMAPMAASPSSAASPPVDPTPGWDAEGNRLKGWGNKMERIRAGKDDPRNQRDRLTVGSLDPGAAAEAQTASSLAGTAGGGHATVRMRSPDGDEDDVPEPYVSFFQSQGAEVI